MIRSGPDTAAANAMTHHTPHPLRIARCRLGNSLARTALALSIGIGACLGAGAQSQTPVAPPSGAQPAGAGAAPASAPAGKKQKRASHAKTPPGKPPRGASVCNQGDNAARQRCLNEMYGPGGPRI